jgi:carboxyl-terminal processing protease
MVGTPAHEAGIQAGDRLLKIDGKTTETMRLADAVKLISGDPGQKITLTVARENSNDPIEVPLTRAEIRVQSVLGDRRVKGNPKAWDYLIDSRDKIGYLRLTGFSETATAEMKAALDDLIRQGARGLVIDLRGNPGGLLRAAVEIADLFLDEGVIVTTRGRDHKEEVHKAHKEGTLFLPAAAFPIAVLVNRNSASASEILAAALQDHGRAVVVGERTYGKGSVQTLTLLERETSALKLTTASYWRPSEKNIHRFPDSTDKDEWGVKPSPGFEVLLTEAERAEYQTYRNDRDVVRPEKESKPEEKPYTDKVLAKALEYIQKKLAERE